MVKIRRDQKPSDYKDPGWYKHPAGTVAYEWTGDMPATTKAPSTGSTAAAIEMRVQKPQGHKH
jgi:hypothetical protein